MQKAMWINEKTIRNGCFLEEKDAKNHFYLPLPAGCAFGTTGEF